jgi:uridine phosphorylase
MLHPTHEPSVFTPESLMDEVRQARGIPPGPLPPLCVLEFDGDLTDALIAQGLAQPLPTWPCFHTTMFGLELEGLACGIIPRTIGGPYAVLVAEQLAAAGAGLIVGLTSAGRISPSLPIPCLVAATSAIRDEGTSSHYLPPAPTVDAPSSIPALLARELASTGWPVRQGAVWTTDAPYRETRSQLDHWAGQGVLAVEMQAASLFAFAQARRVSLGLVAMVSNSVDHAGQQFDTGTPHDGLRILHALARAARAFLTSP